MNGGEANGKEVQLKAAAATSPAKWHYAVIPWETRAREPLHSTGHRRPKAVHCILMCAAPCTTLTLSLNARFSTKKVEAQS
ncbi:hypothetical protein E2C01_088442 [Portunus trituberculatus]|uniref:Uncharacterized protein n=1 Tax=Portunus trituberculatus TaxID=210409 RepID=A0A5B7JJV5_PORTR|nr:hypothetical protein [Portunus trituberculatus]